MTTVHPILSAMVNPTLFYVGAGAMAIPILIHLLSRRRFRRVRWAAMDFLLEADRRNRRRVQIEELILLTLRCLAMLLIGLMLARVFIRPEALAAVLGSPAPTERIIVLDDSFSMALRDRTTAGVPGEATVFEQAASAVERLVIWLREESPHDPLTILLASQPDRPLRSDVNVGKTDVTSLANELDNLGPSARAGNMPAALASVQRRLDAVESNVNAAVYIVSDFQRRDWAAMAKEGKTGREREGETGSSPSRVFDGWSNTQRHLRLVLVDVGNPVTDNVCIAEIEPQQTQVEAGLPAQFLARITNFGLTAAEPSSIEVYVGDAAQPPVPVPAIGPNQTIDVPFEITFGQEGSQTITVERTPDALAIDDVRMHAVPVARALRILVVNGEPAADPYEDEAFLLSVALRPEGPQFSGNNVTIIDENELRDADFSAFHVVVLANVFQVGVDEAARLEGYVSAGGGVAVFLGDQVDPDLYNRRLYRAGQGLLPVELGELAAAPLDRAGVPVGPVDPTHPVMRRFADTAAAYFGGVVIRQYVSCVPTTATSSAPAGDISPVRVLLRLTDDDSSPLIVERGFGQGRVWLVTTSVDKEWNNLADHSVFVVLAMEMVQYLACHDGDQADRFVGQPIRFPLDPGRFEPRVTLKSPAYPDEPATRIDAQPDPDTGRPMIQWRQSDRPGAYTFELTETSGSGAVQQVVVNIDPTESDLRRADRAALLQAIPGLAVEYVSGQQLVADSHSQARQRLWPAILIALAAILVTEQALARWFGARA